MASYAKTKHTKPDLVMTCHRAVHREEKKLRRRFSISRSSSWEGEGLGKNYQTSLTLGGGRESVNTSDKFERDKTD
jgi:hypothetical protein